MENLHGRTHGMRAATHRKTRASRDGRTRTQRLGSRKKRDAKAVRLEEAVRGYAGTVATPVPRTIIVPAAPCFGCAMKAQPFPTGFHQSK
jgi:hypothetical protein